MKKLRFFGLSILILFASLFLVACKKDITVMAENIELSEDSIVLQLGETAEIDVIVSPLNASKKQFEIVEGYDTNVVGIDYDCDSMKIIVTARDFITADLTETIIGVRTVDGSDKEAHLNVMITEDNKSAQTPRNLTFNGKSLTWQFVDNATGYEVNINGDVYIVQSTSNQFLISLDDYAGKSIIAKVRANGLSRNLDSAWTSELRFTILARPTNVQYDDRTKTLTWDEVEGAVSYNVFVNEKPTNVSATSLNLENNFVKEGQYDIRVMAVGTTDGSIVNSAFSNSVIITKLSAPREISIQNGMVFWPTIEGATAYDVEYKFAKNSIVSTNVQTVMSTRFSLPTDVDAGTYSLRIRAIGDGRTTIDGDYGIERGWTKLEKVRNLRVENGDVVWDVNNLATSYTIYFENVLNANNEQINETITQTSGSDVVRYNISKYSSGEYRLNVVANGTSDKISSDKCDQSITVIKLEAPKNLQLSKTTGQSSIMWDSNANANHYLLTLKLDENLEIVVDAVETNKVIYNFNEDVLSVGKNLISVRSIGGEYKNGVWYINSDESENLEFVKINVPEFNLYNIANGFLYWSVNGNNFESYTLRIQTLNGVSIYENTLTNNSFNFNSTVANEFNLPEGEFKVSVKANAKTNTNFFDSNFNQPITIHKLSIEPISMIDGTVNDLQANSEENYTYQYILSNRSAPISSINSYIKSTVASGERFSVKAQAVPVQSTVDDTYYISSDYSNVLYLQKLPTINDASMADGILYYGKSYATLSGYKFEIEIEGSEEVIDNQTNTIYDFSDVDVGEYRLYINAVSTSSGTECSEYSPLNLDSYKMQNPFVFKKLAAPSKIEITSYADSTNTIEGLVNKLSLSNGSGVLVWDSVEGATQYQLTFDDGATTIITAKNFVNLQNSQIGAGVHNVTIKSLGNGSDIISSEDMKEQDSTETYKMYLTKLLSPSKLEIKNGKITWSYANSSDDPNANINNMTLYDALGTSHPLLNSNSKIVTYFLVDSNGHIYNGLDLSDVDFSNVNDVNSGIQAINQFIKALKSNQCDLPDNLNGSTTINVFAVPFNTYINNLLNQEVAITDTCYIVSDFSPELRLTALETPQGLSLDGNKLSWSGLRYNKNDNKKPIKEYEITIKANSEVYSFAVKEDSTKLYEIDSSNKTIYINDLSNSDLCYWNFDKLNFESFFGNGSYLPGNYSITIRALANQETYVDDSGKTYYYVNSHISTAVQTEIFDIPVPRLENGVITWNAVKNAVGYRLYINRTANIAEVDSEYIDLDAGETSFVLGSSYQAGTYYVNIKTLGDGQSSFTAEFDTSNEREFIKLEKISNIYVENGVIKYSQNNVIKTTEANDDGRTYHYSMLIRSYNKEESEDKLYNNGRYIVYELGSDFEGGERYYIRVIATGDSEKYISSDPSNYCYVNGNELPQKLSSPVRVAISDGNITWTSVPYSSKYNVTVAGQSLTTMNTYYDISNIEAGTYSVFVKAIGDNIYLNSTATEKANVKKLSDITGLEIENGSLVWDYVSGSNYVASVSGEDISINSNNAEISNGKIKYSFAQYSAGEYQVYLINNGGSSAISSSKTDTMQLSKLPTPAQLTIMDDNLTFTGVDNSSKYFLSVTLRYGNSDVVTYVVDKLNNANITNTSIMFDLIKHDVDTKFRNSGHNDSINSYEISVVAVGSTDDNLSTSTTYYISSNASEALVITSPASPEIRAINTSAGNFAGKVVWDSVENADYYKVYIKYSNDELNIDQSKIQLFGESNVVSSDVLHDGNYKVFKTTNTYFNLVYAGTYDIVVVASQNKDGYMSNDSNALIGFEYLLFGDNENGNDVAYTITTMEQFNAIQYNLKASYILGVNEFEITDLEIIGSQEEMFVGVFDGNNAEITLLVASGNNNFIGLFGYIGDAEGAIVKNFTLNANVYSIAQTNGSIYVGAVAGFNYGTIENVVVNGEVSTEYNHDSVYIYNAGIVAVNYGTVSKALCKASVLPKNNQNSVYAGGIATINYGTITMSGFKGITSAQIVGGIVSQNLGGDISQCYYETDSIVNTSIISNNDGSSFNSAGGIVGYMNGGSVTHCYANGKIEGRSTDSNNVYVGGLAGYVDGNSSIGMSFVVGYNSSNMVQITASGLYSYAGVFVGDYVTDCSGGLLICLKTTTQKFVGNSKNTLKNTLNCSDLKTTIEQYKNRFDTNGYFVTDDSNSTYPYLKNAKY